MTRLPASDHRGDSRFVGVDIGGTSMEAVVVDASDRVIGQAVLRTGLAGGDKLTSTAIAAIDEALERSALRRDGIGGIGIGVPGQVDVETGIVRMAMNLNIDDGLTIGPSIGREFGVPTSVENDTRAAAVGAHDFMARLVPDLRSIAYLGIGTGISAGLVIDGRVHRGRDGLAGEIGHVVVVDGGPLCRCGLSGCLEAVAAGPAIGRLWPGGDGRAAEDLFRAAAAGNATAARAADTVSGHLVRAIQWLAMAYGADLVVLGGGVGSIGGPFLSAIRDRLGGLADRSDLARRVIPPDRVVSMPAGYPTGAIGAALVARRRLPPGGAEEVGRPTRGGADMKEGEG
jgi:glucokinase